MRMEMHAKTMAAAKLTRRAVERSAARVRPTYDKTPLSWKAKLPACWAALSRRAAYSEKKPTSLSFCRSPSPLDSPAFCDAALLHDLGGSRLAIPWHRLDEVDNSHAADGFIAAFEHVRKSNLAGCKLHLGLLAGDSRLKALLESCCPLL